MSKLVVCGVWDEKAQQYLRPFYVVHQGVGIRWFHDEVGREASLGENPLFHHPGDFELHRLGTWDDQTNEVEGFGASEVLARGRDFKAS